MARVTVYLDQNMAGLGGQFISSANMIERAAEYLGLQPAQFSTHFNSSTCTLNFDLLTTPGQDVYNKHRIAQTYDILEEHILSISVSNKSHV